MKTVLAIAAGVVAVMLATSARAQAFFIDRFDGTRLRPHWQQPPPEHWEHTVGGGQLTVTDLFHPGVPGQLNTASINAELPDFSIYGMVVTTLLGWEAGEGRVLAVRMLNSEGLVVAFGYDESGPEPVLFIESPGGSPPYYSTPAPDPGIHEFRLFEELGDGFFLLVDGVTPLGVVNTTGGPISRLEILFAEADGAPFSPLSVGLARIVPSPGTALVLVTVIGLGVARRRR